MTRLEKTDRTRQCVYNYISEHEGCTKLAIRGVFGLSKNQLDYCLSELKSKIRCVTIYSGRVRAATYYISEGEPPQSDIIVPTIKGARVVQAGKLLLEKHGYTSPELRKVGHSGIGSSMGDMA